MNARGWKAMAFVLFALVLVLLAGLAAAGGPYPDACAPRVSHVDEIGNRTDYRLVRIVRRHRLINGEEVLRCVYETFEAGN